MSKDILILSNESIKNALKKLELTAEKVLVVVNNKKKLLGTLTDGDIRRAILKGYDLNEIIEDAYNRNPLYFVENEYTKDDAREFFLNKKIELIPIVKNDKTFVDYIIWEQLFKETKKPSITYDKIEFPVVIMAGGKGTRLMPFTTVLPKPLIPIGEKTILELIINEFSNHQIKKYYFTINYKGEMIRSYFESIERDYEIDYVCEKDYLGTAGSLKLLEAKIENTFFVSNCDIIVKADFADVLKLHKTSNAYLTILSSIQHYTIPYGIVHFKNGGEVTEIVEKPEYSYPINTGVYILEKNALRYIPENTPFDMTQLIDALIKDRKKVVTYPVNEKNYRDIGKWEDYKKTVEMIF